jgi:hypothetical protein
MDNTNNNIFETILNNNINNLQNLNKNKINTDDYFSEVFKNVDKKQNTNSISDRINNLKKSNNLFGENNINIKGVNNANNLMANSKYSNFDKIFKSNYINTNKGIPSSATTSNKNYNIINSKNKPNTDFTKNNKREIGQFTSNKNNFDLLEAQLNSLKTQTNKTKNNINRIYNQILGENSNNNNLNMFKNYDEKNNNNYNNKILDDKFNQSLEECDILFNNLRDN